MVDDEDPEVAPVDVRLLPFMILGSVILLLTILVLGVLIYRLGHDASELVSGIAVVP